MSVTSRFRVLAIATFLVVVAIASTASAGAGGKTAPKNSVVSSSIKNGQVKGADLAKKSVSAKNVKPNGLTGATIKELTLDFSVLQKRVSGSCPAGQAIRAVNANGTVVCATAAAGSAWSLSGNSGTTPSTNFLGTIDNQALNLRVNNQRAFRVEPNAISPNIVGGFSSNSASPGISGAAIGGGGTSTAPNVVTDNDGTIGGGSGNQAGDDLANVQSSGATVGGGVGSGATGSFATVGGGNANIASGDGATVAGGKNNVAASFATVGGGSANGATGASSTIGGGSNQSAPGVNSTVGGGTSNVAIGQFSTIAGGSNQIASAANATVGGGSSNKASGASSTLAGGSNQVAFGELSTIGGGEANVASGTSSTVGGGSTNAAGADLATVAGGANNSANGVGSFVAGVRGTANQFGTFVFSDVSNNNQFVSNTGNEFAVRSAGGARFVTATNATTGATTAGVQVAAGGGSWSSLSDRHSKNHVEPLSGSAVLRKVEALPVHTWSYKTQDPSIRHAGPMAQAFRKAFGLGEDSRHIDDVDAQGIALAAVKGAAAKIHAQHRTLRSQGRQIAQLRKAVKRLEQR